jgi:AraC family transcriptional regulator, regulatory protein of adaptative response / methylated-DNA-[protein]-cysteine methyltransferase
MDRTIKKSSMAAGKPRIFADRYLTAESRWAAVRRREAAADGQFYYSVETTGVYCRPTCASRLPRQENVRFHNSCEAAERAGFRACKRCQPNGRSLAEAHAAKVAAACRAIEAAETPPSLDALARTAAMSRFHFQRVFTKIVGLTPKAYAQARRADRVRAALGGNATVTEALYEAGFNSSGRFYAESSQMLGMTPKRFRAGGKGETIRFATRASSLGIVLVAASDKGVCAIALGDEADPLVRELRQRFPKAELVGGDASFENIVRLVIALAENPKASFELPLDIRGTAFQRRVWDALRHIPMGTTTNYTALAVSLGRPEAVRAVARACASNRIALAIPCHRVVRADGHLAGYRWGLERKRELLRREGG